VDKNEQILKLFKDGYSISKIKNIVHSNHRRIHKILTNNGCDTKRHSSLHLDENYICKLYLTKKYHAFQIVGTKELLLPIQHILIKYIGVRKNKLTNNIKGKNHYALRYNGKIQSMKIMDWLYEHKPEWYMDRKYNSYLLEKKKRE